MKITGRIEKIANITSIVIESRGISGRIDFHSQMAEVTDGQEIQIEICPREGKHLSRTYSPLFQPCNEPPIIDEELEQRTIDAASAALDTK